MGYSKKKIVSSILALFVATACISVFFPNRAIFDYDYEIGDKWKYETLYSDFSFPILKSEEQIQDEVSRLSSQFIPYYRYSREAVDESLSALDKLEIPSDVKSRIAFSLDEMFEKGIIDGKVYSDDVSSGSRMIFVQKDKRAQKYPVDEFYSLSLARQKLSELSATVPEYASEIQNLVRPNLIYDDQLTNLVRDDERSSVSYTDGYVDAGNLIVSKGEVITPELHQIIDSYRREFANTGNSGVGNWMALMGYVIYTLILLFALFLVVRMVKPEIIGTNSFYYILLIYVLFYIAILVMVTRVDESYLLLFPFTLIALLLQAFFRPKLVIPVYLMTLMPLLLLSNNGHAFYLIYALAGIVSIFLFPHFNKGWKQFLLAFIVFLLLTAFSSLSYAINPLVAIGPFRRIFYMFVGSFLTVACYPLVYLFEKIFNLVSNSRLVEIGDTSSHLLRLLESTAPGTLQHSLQVMNMADYAARAIDANPLLVRAGALYHDIGKMSNPLCFVENESLLASESDNKYHSNLTAEQSAQEIIRHVPEGVRIAREHRLPEVVIDFIRSHHGTGCVQFFYTKFLNEGGSEAEMSKFCYDGIKPRTREQVIVMLCDTIEAASRSLADNTPESYAQFVHSVISGKLHQGQMDDADISVRELGILEEALRSYLAQMYHARIDYPKRKLNLNNTKS